MAALIGDVNFNGAALVQQDTYYDQSFTAATEAERSKLETEHKRRG
jgi:hypothetical protein